MGSSFRIKSVLVLCPFPKDSVFLFQNITSALEVTETQKRRKACFMHPRKDITAE